MNTLAASEDTTGTNKCYQINKKKQEEKTMKSYKEMSEILENHIDVEMKSPKGALAKDIAYAMEMWNTSMIRSDKEKDRFSLEEKEERYIKMLEYAERLMEPALNTPNEFGVYRGMYVFHIYTTMKDTIEEIQNVKKC